MLNFIPRATYPDKKVKPKKASITTSKKSTKDIWAAHCMNASYIWAFNGKR